MKRFFNLLPKEARIQVKEDLDRIFDAINFGLGEFEIYKIVNNTLIFHKENTFPDLSVEFLQKEIFPQPYSQRYLNVYKKNIKFLNELLNNI